MKSICSNDMIRSAHTPGPNSATGFCACALLCGILIFSFPGPSNAADYTRDVKWNDGNYELITVNLHFNKSPQTRTVLINAESDYVFKGAFTLASPLPSNLVLPQWDGTGIPAAGQNSKTISFQWTGGPDQEVSVTLHNALVPTGGGGSGPPPEKPFDLTAFIYFVYCKLEKTDGTEIKELVMPTESTETVVGRLVMGNGKVPNTRSTLQLESPSNLATASPTGPQSINGQGKVLFTVQAGPKPGGPKDMKLSNPSLDDESVPVNLQAKTAKVPLTTIKVKFVDLEFLEVNQVTYKDLVIGAAGNPGVKFLGTALNGREGVAKLVVPGELVLDQDVKTSRTILFKDGSSLVKASTGFAIDERDMQAKVVNTPPKMEISSGDRPKLNVPPAAEARIQRIRILDNYKLYLRFKPTNGDAYTLGILGWQFSADVQPAGNVLILKHGAQDDISPGRASTAEPLGPGAPSVHQLKFEVIVPKGMKPENSDAFKFKQQFDNLNQ